MNKPTDILNHRAPPRWRPAFLSLVFHAFLIGSLLALLTLSSTPPGEPLGRPGQIVIAMPSTSPAVDYLESSDDAESTVDAISEKSSPMVDTSAPPLSAIANPSLPLPGMSHVDVDRSTDMTEESAMPGTANHRYRLSSEDMKLIDEDRRLIQSRQPAGPATSIQLFGSGNLTGRKFVFLLDCSASMGDGGLGVLSRACYELINAIRPLEAHHEFQIVAYQQQARSISGRRLLPATPENKRRVRGFMDDLFAEGGTDHRHAVYFALSLNPDVIVVLSDGGLPLLHAGHLRAIRRSAEPETQIHTFQFGRGPRRSAAGFLDSLAEQNAGTYRYIDVQRWNRKTELSDFP